MHRCSTILFSCHPLKWDELAHMYKNRIHTLLRIIVEVVRHLIIVKFSGVSAQLKGLYFTAVKSTQILPKL